MIGKAIISELEPIAFYIRKEVKSVPKKVGLLNAKTGHDTIKANESSTDTLTLVKLK